MLAERAISEELLDEPGVDPTLAAASYRFMHMVNHVFGGAAPVRRFIRAQAAALREDRPLHVLDVGAGDCGLPLALLAWADRQGLDVRFTCVDLCDHAAEMAREAIRAAGDERCTFNHSDVFHMEPGPWDCAVASMFLHHFPDESIPGLAAHVCDLVSGPVLINDLHRSWSTYAGAWLLTRGRHPGVKHDALLSVRRGFRAPQLADLLGRVSGRTARVMTHFPGRITAVIQ